MEPWALHRMRVSGLWHGRGRVLRTGLHKAGTASLGHKQEGGSEVVLLWGNGAQTPFLVSLNPSVPTPGAA